MESGSKLVRQTRLPTIAVRASRIEKQGDGSECTVDDIPGICAEDEVKVEFYCWDAGEINHWCFHKAKSSKNYSCSISRCHPLPPPPPPPKKKK